MPHAVKQMSRPDRMISVDDVKEAVLLCEIIEEYPDDPRGKSCLIFHKASHRVIHVVCTPNDEYLAIITAYIPNPEQWSADLKQRKE